MKWIHKLFRKEQKSYYTQQELQEIDDWLGRGMSKQLYSKYRLTLDAARSISYRWLVFDEKKIERLWEPLECKEW